MRYDSKDEPTDRGASSRSRPQRSAGGHSGRIDAF